MSEFDRMKRKIKRLKEKVRPEFFKERNYMSSIVTLLSLSKEMSSTLDLDRLLTEVVDDAIKIAKAERGFLMLLDENGHLQFRTSRKLGKETIARHEFDLSRSIVNEVAATGRAIVLPDVYKDKKISERSSIIALGLAMIICLPLLYKNRLIGLIYLDSRTPVQDFSEFDKALLESFSALAAIAIEHARLYTSVICDPLTGVYNQNYMINRINQEICRLRRYHSQFSFMLIDIDNFKKINDIHGWQGGNLILKSLSRIIKENLRGVDILARQGGDKFSLLMPETNETGALSLARRIKEVTESYLFKINEKNLHITLSIGAVTFSKGEPEDCEQLIIEAENSLRVSKNKGGSTITHSVLKEEITPEQIEFIGESKVAQDILLTVKKIAPIDATVLVTGETGTGKELIARIIHNLSMRSKKPFIVVNCGAIPEGLLESELFGHERGSFTGAYTQYRGRFEEANGGTIFLDEIADMPLHLQIKLLRAIEAKEIQRIGGKSNLKVDIRIITSTNRNLEEEVKNNKFRKDLYYRLNVVSIHLPPLRERIEDLPVLVRYFIKKYSEKYDKKIRSIDDDLIRELCSYEWPGNVRELEHYIERGVINDIDGIITGEDLEFHPQIRVKDISLKKTKKRLELEMLTSVLIRNRGNVTRSAQELEISRKTLYNLLKRYRINIKDLIKFD